MFKTYLIASMSLLTLVSSITCHAEELILKEDTLGPITKSTPFDVNTLQHLLPGYKVRKTIGVTESTPYIVIVVYENDKPRLTIVPKSQESQKIIYCISFTSKKIKNSLGALIGEKFGNIYKAGTAHCVPAREEMSGLAICAAPNVEHVAYIFARNKRWNGANDTVPPLNVMQEWTLKQVTWIPDADDVLKDHQYCKAVELYAK